MYEKFLDKSLNSTRQTVDDTFIAKYANAVSEKIIELWKEVGLGTFCDGLFRIINPNKYQTIVDDSYPLYEYETVTLYFQDRSAILAFPPSPSERSGGGEGGNA